MAEGTNGERIVWYNTGYADDGYVNTYVSFDGSGEPPTTGTVPGSVLATGFCQGANYAIVEDVDSVTWDGPTRSWLYRIEQAAKPQIVSEWTSASGFRPLSRTAACDDIGRLHVLHGSTGTRAAPPTDGPTLAVLDTRMPSEPVNTLLASPYTWRTPSGAIALRDGQLLWVTSDGDVVQAAPKSMGVVRLWGLPSAVESGTVSLSPDGATVTAVIRSTSNDFHYEQFDAATGTPVAEPVPLPWLSEIVDTVTESGQSTYRLTDVESLR